MSGRFAFAVFILVALGSSLISPAISAARADFSIGVVGIDTFSTPSASQTDTSYDFTSRSGLGVGLETQFTFHGNLGLEFGVLYVSRRYSTTATVQSTSVVKIDGDIYSVPAIEIPFLVTYSPTSWFSFGLGGYYASLGDQVSVDEGGVTSTQSLAQTELTGKDYGLMASLRLLVPIVSLGSSKLSLLAEGQLLYGLANTAAPGGADTFHYRDSQILIGVALASF